MYHPITGKVENIDSLLGGPDALNWYKSLTTQRVGLLDARSQKLKHY
jgi:hypothetical protein